MNLAELSDALGDAKKQMLIHGSIFLAGASLTAVTYSASINGGTYVMCFGAIIFGGYRFLRGLYYFTRISHAIKELKKYNSNLLACANYMAALLGYGNFDELEKREMERVGFSITEREDTGERLNSFSRHYGVQTFKELYEKTVDDILNPKQISEAQEG